nr:uncharacterized protein LOC112004511 [Quercus suber]
MSNTEKYLGLPIASGKSKVNTFKELQEKITKRVIGWKEKFISKAGREILIKTVAQAIPTYSMCLFKIPKAICDNINSILSKYWWGQTKEERKIHWINWQKLCRHKKKGGMGFRDVSTFNLAMLAKQAWRLIHNSHSLFYRVYKARYFPNCNFMLAELGPNPSYVWRSLLAARDVIREGSIWKVGDGRNIGMISHKWLQNEPVFLNEPDEQMHVSDLINHDTRQWDRGKLVATFTQSTCKEILALPLNHLDSQDNLTWTANKTQKFSVKSAYRVALKLKYGDGAEHSSA